MTDERRNDATLADADESTPAIDSIRSDVDRAASNLHDLHAVVRRLAGAAPEDVPPLARIVQRELRAATELLSGVSGDLLCLRRFQDDARRFSGTVSRT